MSEVETFAFDDFFVDDSDGGVDETVTLTDKNGNERAVTLKVKRGLSLGDYSAAQSRATKTHISPKGELVVDGIDQSVFAIELLYLVIKAWPFTRPDGNRVPVSREHLRNMYAASSAGLQPLVEKLMHNRKEELAPFVKPSDGDS